MLKYIVYAIMFAIFICALIYFNIEANKETLEYNFTGRVESVTYDVKGIHSVVINKKKYYLSGYNFHHKIEKGDSLIEQKGMITYKLVKYKTGKIFEFK